ncbi:helix-turn-helix transcriptional regulator [Proteobacteria bacterium 005FR1]|nr:helix-turn-helix transcriptional regulator [Proteobacteria bacterium 005FR1]
MITAGQIRMARAFLRWSIEDLAKKSGVGASTIKRMETFDGIPSSRVENLQAIKDTFFATGKIRFEKETCVCVEE